MIGRKKEKNILHDCLASNRPDFLALYESFMVPGNNVVYLSCKVR